MTPCSEPGPRFLGKDPRSQEGQSPTLFATDRTDRKTHIAQGWVVTDPQALADVGMIPEGEGLIEILEDVLKLCPFDEQEHFLGGEIIEDPAVIVQHNYWRDAAWHRAVRRDDFANE